MSSWILPIVPLFVILVAVAVLGRRRGVGPVGYPYLPVSALFSAAERSFLGVLDQAVGPGYRVFGKVRVADVAMARPGLGRSAGQGALNRIAYKHFDFVVCRSSDLSIVCAVELNDASHSSRRSRSRDDFLLKVCQAVGIPLLTVPARQAYSHRRSARSSWPQSPRRERVLRAV